MLKDNLVSDITKMVEPIVIQLGYELYYIEYVKDHNDYYLRIYIDKPEGITLTDCEKVSRLVSDLLDEKDPIKDSYHLEVSSPGIFRQLFTDEHMKKYTGSDVKVKLSKAIDNKKHLKGILKDFSDDAVTLNIDGEYVELSREKIKSINLEGDL